MGNIVYIYTCIVYIICMYVCIYMWVLKSEQELWWIHLRMVYTTTMRVQIVFLAMLPSAAYHWKYRAFMVSLPGKVTEPVIKCSIIPRSFRQKLF